MQPVQFFAINAKTNAALSGAAVDVFVAGSSQGIRAQLFNASGVAISNPTNADSNGMVYFQTSAAIVDVYVSSASYTMPPIMGLQVNELALSGYNLKGLFKIGQAYAQNDVVLDGAAPAPGTAYYALGAVPNPTLVPSADPTNWSTSAGLGATNAATAVAQAAIAVAAANSAVSAAASAVATTAIYASTADALSNGIKNYTGLTGGSGGTNGTFAVAFSGGGGSGALANFTVAGGALISITPIAPGKNYTSAPTLSFAASAGLTSAAATAVIGPNVALGSYFSIPSASANGVLDLYSVTAGPAATFTGQSFPNITASQISTQQQPARASGADVDALGNFSRMKGSPDGTERIGTLLVSRTFNGFDAAEVNEAIRVSLARSRYRGRAHFPYQVNIVLKSGQSPSEGAQAFVPAQNGVFSANPASGSTITLNGTVVTFGTDVAIGVDLNTTLQSLKTYLQASADAQLVKFQYALDSATAATTLMLTAVSTLTNIAAVALTLASSTSPASNCVFGNVTLCSVLSLTPRRGVVQSDAIRCRHFTGAPTGGPFTPAVERMDFPLGQPPQTAWGETGLRKSCSFALDLFETENGATWDTHGNMLLPLCVGLSGSDVPAFSYGTAHFTSMTGQLQAIKNECTRIGLTCGIVGIMWEWGADGYTDGVSQDQWIDRLYQYKDDVESYWVTSIFGQRRDMLPFGIFQDFSHGARSHAGNPYGAIAENYVAQANSISFPFTANPAAGSSITLNGKVVTFGSDVAIGTLLSDTVTNLVTYLKASTDPQLIKFNYRANFAPSGGNHLLVSAAKGTGSPTLTVGCSTSPASNCILQMQFLKRNFDIIGAGAPYFLEVGGVHHSAREQDMEAALGGLWLKRRVFDLEPWPNLIPTISRADANTVRLTFADQAAAMLFDRIQTNVMANKSMQANYGFELYQPSAPTVVQPLAYAPYVHGNMIDLVIASGPLGAAGSQSIRYGANTVAGNIILKPQVAEYFDTTVINGVVETIYHYIPVLDYPVP